MNLCDFCGRPGAESDGLCPPCRTWLEGEKAFVEEVEREERDRGVWIPDDWGEA